MIPGIDVSHWQGDIDWKKVKEAGVKFAFIKASEFPDKKITMYEDEKFKVNRAGAIENGIYWGAYHFFRTHVDPIHQAESFCKFVGEVDSLPLVLDLEVAGSKGSTLVRKVKSFVETCTSISGRKIIIYTSGGFWRPYMTYEKLTDVDWAVEYPLWMARYTSQWPGAIYPWSAWDFWQYSDHGRIPGIKASVDLNWFSGSLEDLRERFLPAGPQQIAAEKEEEIPEPIVVENNTPQSEPQGTGSAETTITEEIAEEEIAGSIESSEPISSPGQSTTSTTTNVNEDVNASSGNEPAVSINTNKNIPCLLSFFQYAFTAKKKEKKVDPQESQDWIDDLVCRDKKKR
jgi:lysozyme